MAISISALSFSSIITVNVEELGTELHFVSEHHQSVISMHHNVLAVRQESQSEHWARRELLGGRLSALAGGPLLYYQRQ